MKVTFEFEKGERPESDEQTLVFDHVYCCVFNGRSQYAGKKTEPTPFSFGNDMPELLALCDETKHRIGMDVRQREVNWLLEQLAKLHGDPAS